MSPNLTEKEFAKHVNTKFRVKVDSPGPINLNLDEAKSYLPQENEPAGLERFSIFFTGPVDPLLPQASYRLDHEVMGAFDLFLVPIGRDERGCRYEAVFNYFKS